MGEHFVLLVDRLLTESTLEAALESRHRSMEAAASSALKDEEVVDVSLKKIDLEDLKSQGKLVQCKICHDEDEISNMETPCSCSGSLKYAHRKCIQQWCNQKGNTTCEICLQQYKPGYTAPPPLFRFGRIPMSFRGNWEISRRDLDSTTRIRVVSPAQNFTNFNYNHYSVSVVCCSIGIFSMVLLILRHFLPLLQMIENMEYSIPLFMLLLMRILAIALPIYIMVRAVTFMQRLRQQQQQQREPPNASGNLSDSRNQRPASRPLPLVDHV